MKSLKNCLLEGLRIGINDKPEEDIFEMLKEKYEYIFRTFEIDPTMSNKTHTFIALGAIKELSIDKYEKCFYKGDYLGDPAWGINIYFQNDGQKIREITFNGYQNISTNDSFQYDRSLLKYNEFVIGKSLEDFMDKMDEFIKNYGIQKQQ